MLRMLARDLLKWTSPMRSISNMPVSLNRDLVRVSPTESFESEGQNVMMKQLHSAGDSLELLKMIAKTSKQDIEPQHLTFALNRLFTLHKNDDYSVHPSQLTKHQGFSNLCHLLKFKGPRMESNDLVACLKVLCYFGLKSDNLTVQRILHLVKDQINEFTPNSLMFLSFLLNKMEPTPLTDALLIAIPVVFDLNLSQRIDHNNTVELTKLLHYLTHTRMKISNRSMTNIFSALLLNGDNLDLQQAKSVVWSFTVMRELDPAYEKLYHNSIGILNANIAELSLADVETTLNKMIERCVSGEPAFLSESFLDNVASYLVEKDVGFLQASYFLKKFNKIYFVNYNLLDYIDKAIVSNHASLSSCKTSGLLTFAAAFANAGYKSENWEIIKSVLSENPLIHNEQIRLPWIQFANGLMSLDFHSNIMLERIFSTKFLEKFLSREDNALDYVQLLLLWQSVKLLIPDYDGPLPEQRFIDDAIVVNFRRPNEKFTKTLADVFGGPEFVQTNVKSSYGHCLDHVISFDSNEQPIAMPCKIRSYDELPKSQVKSIAVFFNSRACYPLNMPHKLRGVPDLRRRTMEALGIRTVQISTFVWNNLPEDEKLDYLEREVRYALK